MNRTTKVLAAALATGMLATVTACGGSDDAAGGSNEVTILYRPGSLSDSAVSGAQQAFPDAKIKFIKTADVDTKLGAALRTGKDLPSIVTADPIRYAPVEGKFTDVSKTGFTPGVASGYLPWKTDLGRTASGAQLGVPIDVGPLAYYYNADAFKAAGLPTDPEAVGRLVSTWAGYKSLAQKAKAKGKFACDDPSQLFYYETWSKAFGFYKKDGDDLVPDIANTIGKTAFDRAMDFQSSDLCLNVQSSSNDWNSGLNRGTLIGFLQPPWVGGGALQTAVKGQAGKWRVATATPDGYASADGSMLMLPRNSTDPELATKVAIWLTNATNQATGYVKNGLFPSALGAYASPEFTAPQPFYGNQPAASTLAEISKKAPQIVKGPDTDSINAIFQQAIRDAASSGTSASKAYDSAVDKATQQFGK
ncbi:ABC transporter substrate-binding protein [Streptomyces sp. MSC1_001]|jgi:cellobiose transport system substrate-binding protein|uniref:ABC transporter substrate-binding protein n=1 Tax=Streptomyces sp. MSC1_001 TaxID=2909263 RepID=UPI00202F3677|nr:ABC transporter substrate-binding protein [Streptomyces sp. MSC1_001]